MHFNSVIYSKEELFVNIFNSVVHREGSSTLPRGLTVKRTKTCPIPKLARSRFTVL